MMKSIRALLLCAAAAAILAGCGGSSADSELRRQLEEEANDHREKCARAAKHGWTAEMKEWGCPQNAAASQSN